MNEVVVEYAQGFSAGVEQERERIIKLAENMICFDHRADNTCEHGGCWSLTELIRKTRKLTDGDA